jgi:hypothetical protein
MPASKLRVIWSHKIILGGPAHLEQSARARLARVLYEGVAEGYEGAGWDGLSECYYLDDSGRAAHYADEIAAEVPYQVRGRRIVVRVVELDVTYKNPPGPMKWWARIRDGVQTIEAGDEV